MPLELLRDSTIYSEPYFEVLDIIVGQGHALREFDAMLREEQP